MKRRLRREWLYYSKSGANFEALDDISAPGLKGRSNWSIYGTLLGGLYLGDSTWGTLLGGLYLGDSTWGLNLLVEPMALSCAADWATRFEALSRLSKVPASVHQPSRTSQLISPDSI